MNELDLLKKKLEHITEEYIKARNTCNQMNCEYWRGAKNELTKIIKELEKCKTQ